MPDKKVWYVPAKVERKTGSLGMGKWNSKLVTDTFYMDVVTRQEAVEQVKNKPDVRKVYEDRVKLVDKL